jgi:hypothetical protein
VAENVESAITEAHKELSSLREEIQSQGLQEQHKKQLRAVADRLNSVIDTPAQSW